jgi:hypothetical protein
MFLDILPGKDKWRASSVACFVACDVNTYLQKMSTMLKANSLFIE